MEGSQVRRERRGVECAPQCARQLLALPVRESPRLMTRSRTERTWSEYPRLARSARISLRSNSFPISAPYRGDRARGWVSEVHASWNGPCIKTSPALDNYRWIDRSRKVHADKGYARGSPNPHLFPPTTRIGGRRRAAQCGRMCSRIQGSTGPQAPN